MADEIEKTEETWVYGGTRVAASGIKAHAWVTPDGAEILYKGGNPSAIGYSYTARVVRDGSQVSLYGRPTYTGERAPEDVRERLSVAHRAAETYLNLKARERKAKEDDPLELAIQRLGEMISAAPSNQQTALKGYVVARLSRYW